MRKSIVLYTRFFEQIKKLDEQQRGVLFTAIMAYSTEEPLPDMDAVTDMLFSVIKAQLDEDDMKYQEKCRARSEAGAKGGRPKKQEEDLTEKQKNQLVSEESKKSKSFFEKAKKPDNDNVNDNENDNDILKDNMSSGTSPDHSEDQSKEIIGYLNQKTGKHFLDKSKDSRSLIRARVREGFTVDDFKKVIDIKAEEWGSDPQMEQYLRPKTLFGAKFESYLNQRTIAKKATKFSNFTERPAQENLKIAEMIEKRQLEEMLKGG